MGINKNTLNGGDCGGQRKQKRKRDRGITLSTLDRDSNVHTHIHFPGHSTLGNGQRFYVSFLLITFRRGSTISRRNTHIHVCALEMMMALEEMGNLLRFLGAVDDYIRALLSASLGRLSGNFSPRDTPTFVRGFFLYKTKYEILTNPNSVTLRRRRRKRRC